MIEFSEKNQKQSALPVSVERHLSDAGIKPTIQRIEIAKVMLEKQQHLSAEQVLSLVNKQKEIVSKATVYNTLNLFVQRNLIRQVIVNPVKVFYDSNTSQHHHFYNEDTGEVSDFKADNIKVGPLPSLPINTKQSGIDIIVRIKDL